VRRIVMGGSHHRRAGDMSTAAIVLAVALLISAGPSQLRRRVGRASMPVPAARRERTEADPLALASALDIFAVCLSAGMTVSSAAAVAGPSAPPGLREVLQRASDLLALGADAATAWSTTAEEPECESLMRLARRSSVSGAALADGVAELAEQARRDAAHRAAAAAERAGVLIAGPLGLCFLPAFVCLGIVPVVVGLARDVFGGGLL
jgi:pilus assembly protein TadC